MREGRGKANRREKKKKMRELTVLLGIRREQTLASFRAVTLQFKKIFGVCRGIELQQWID